MSKIDFNWIAAEALANSETLVTGWLSDGKYEGREWVARNPKRNDTKAGSFKVNLDSGVWSDFASGDGGADLIALYAFLNDEKQGDAAKAIAEQLNISPERSSGTSPPAKKTQSSVTWVPVIPVPFDVNVVPVKHYKYGEPSRRWEYLDGEGRLLCYVCRFDVKPRKQILPLTWCKSSTGKFDWRWKGLDAPRPLYNLDKLTANVKARVIFCEGEKAADAALVLFPASIPTTSFNGVKGWKYADYSVLVDREVIFWRDNDDEGLGYARNVTAKLQSQGCTVKWFVVPENAPDKWDAADAVDEGWTHEKVKQLASDGLLLMEPGVASGGNDDDNFKPYNNSVPVNPATGSAWPCVEFGWEISNDGVFDLKKQVVCLRPVWVDALTINSAKRWGVVIKFFDHDWCFKTMTMPDEQLHEQAGILGKELAASGLPVIPGKEKMLSRFIVMLKNDVTKRILASNRLGWYDSPESKPVFILPSQVLGECEQDIVFQPDTQAYISETIHGKGDLQQWQLNIAKPCDGNSILMFAVMMALAGPLLKLCQEQSGGFHLYGVTTGGKTTSAQVAASVWGCGADPQEGPEVTSLRKWYLTGNALEGIAEVHNDTLLTLDEISEVDPNELGRIIYQLAGGLSKGRANATGGLRAMRTWRLLFFSTGEKSVRQILGQVGQSQKGGQRVRLPDIPADDIETGNRAIITDTHGKVAKEFVQDLKLSCARYYGLAGPVFAAYLIGQAEAVGTSVLSGHLREELREIERILMDDLTVKLPPEGSRVLRRFALIALAGIRAGQPLDNKHVTAGILPWSPDAIMNAIRDVRDRWLSDLGTEQSESERGLSHLRDKLMSCTDKFMDIGNASAGRDIVGYRANDYYLLTKSGLQELCGEFDMNTLLKELRSRDLLKCEKGRLTHKAPTIKSLSGRRPNLYWISLDFIGVKVANHDIADFEAGVTQIKPMDYDYGEQSSVPF